ncbi:MAG TPA: branched-chain amino acid ABC transporter permease [Bradyrhizobium sp.]|nr:branched-chain amino acid ABC transporter permease [Bradyrhizobium sp.]
MTSLPSKLPLVSAARGVLGLLAAMLFAAPWIFGPAELQILTELLCLLVLAMMWNLLAGYADIVTIGQHGFVGIGCYSFYGFVVLAGVGPYLAILLAGLTTLVFAVPAMVIIFRLRAAYLAVGTWVLAEVMMLGAGKIEAFGAGLGISLPVSVVREFGGNIVERFTTIYWISLALALVAMGATYALMRSAVGIGLTAMRDNEEAAGTIGVNLFRARVICFLWTAPFLGLAGALITLQKLRIAPAASFSITDWTVYIIFIVVIGGVGSFEGPIIGTLVFFAIREYLQDWGVWHFIILGGVSIATVLIEPRGIWGLLRRVIPADLIPVAHTPPR